MSQIEVTIARVFGAVLREMRTAKGLSQESLAERCGLDRTFISLLERGLRQPSLATLQRLSEGMGVTLSRLVADFEGKYRRPER